MLTIQKITLAIILITGGAITLTVLIISKNKSGLWLIKYGLFLIIIGLASSVIMTNRNLIEVISFIDSAGPGRAYVIGCALLLSGIILEIVMIIKKI